VKGFLPLAIPVAAGLGLGLLAPSLAVRMQPLAQLFIHLLGWLTYPLIFCMLVSSASTLGRQREPGRIAALAFAYFALLSLLSMLFGLAAGWALEPGAGAVLASASLPAMPAPAETSASMPGWLDRLPSLKANNLLLLAAALPAGLLLGRFPDTRVPAWVERCRLALFGVIKRLLVFAPLAAFGAMAAAVGRHGLAPLLPLLKFIAAINLASALFVLVVLGGAAWLAGMPLLRFIAYIRAELYLVFFTSSSLAGLVPLSEKLQGLGCPRQVTDVVLPFSYSLNLAGTYLYIAMGLTFLAQAAGVRLGWHELAWMLGMALVSSKGAVGVAGSGVATLAATVALLHVVPPELMAILFAIDRTMKCRLLTNVIGHGVACVVVAAADRCLDRKALAQALSPARSP